MAGTPPSRPSSPSPGPPAARLRDHRRGRRLDRDTAGAALSRGVQVVRKAPAGLESALIRARRRGPAAPGSSGRDSSAPDQPLQVAARGWRGFLTRRCPAFRKAAALAQARGRLLEGRRRDAGRSAQAAATSADASGATLHSTGTPSAAAPPPRDEGAASASWSFPRADRLPAETIQSALAQTYQHWFPAGLTAGPAMSGRVDLSDPASAAPQENRGRRRQNHGLEAAEGVHAS
jgi:hypothetical protein